MTDRSPYVRHEPPYATLSSGMMRLLVTKGVGRNGWAVMAALCCGVHEDRTLDRRSAAAICNITGLTPNQVARGMAELRGKGVIAPVTRINSVGYAHPDRSNFGHVAQYCFTKEAWKRIIRNSSC